MASNYRSPVPRHLAVHHSGEGRVSLRFRRNAKVAVEIASAKVSIGIRGTTIKISNKSDGPAEFFFERRQGSVENSAGQRVDVSEEELVEVASEGALVQPGRTDWLADENAVDQGLQAFAVIFGGPGAGSGGNGRVSSQSGPADSTVS